MYKYDVYIFDFTIIQAIEASHVFHHIQTDLMQEGNGNGRKTKNLRIWIVTGIKDTDYEIEHHRDRGIRLYVKLQNDFDANLDHARDRGRH